MTATPCFRAEILGFEPPGTPQNQQVYGAMDPLLAYALAPMHLSAFDIPRGSGETTWETTTSSTSTATPCFRAEILGFEPPGTPQNQQVYGAMDPLLAYALALMHLYQPQGVVQDWRGGHGYRGLGRDWQGGWVWWGHWGAWDFCSGAAGLRLVRLAVAAAVARGGRGPGCGSRRGCGRDWRVEGGGMGGGGGTEARTGRC
ncbi:hypothetical protein THAOC_24639 [Thalassiosira oceanica]|uniref:Uncharacterized protein n=1 Tax=Thalassiosira oceanica TaxID=159749 RepID=K0RRF1_THAOC|nr:hypothetical protein THAOC_24639 [Thalassiosira oceanica]|eukprot:EJK55615.1 hypothetical protein THAOC_24639 [Thalassiosira oceanica]